MIRQAPGPLRTRVRKPAKDNDGIFDGIENAKNVSRLIEILE
jgi:hypothetical protein